MNRELKIASWNVRGLGDPHRALILKNWMCKGYDSIDVMCLQELQASESCILFQLQSIFPTGTSVIDSLDSGRVGSAVLLAPHLVILDQGSRGDGTFSWAKIETSKGPVHVGLIYAPAERAKRISLWTWLREFVQSEDNWLIGGDLNMMEFLKDSAGTSALLHGAEARSWARAQDQLDLLDLYLILSQRRGSWYTQQAMCGERLDRARSDRFYCNNRGE
jgi:exonuclease III